MDTLDGRIERIAAKVRARSMRVGATLSEQDVSTFEARYSVTLPDGYRQFLLRIGNEAPGPPSYGLIPLAEPPTGHGDHRSHTNEEFTALKQAFPFTKPWIWEND